MGQPITVVETRSHRPGIVRFEINRPLSGMGHERYVKDELVEGNRPVDELARRVFEHGGVDAVHINGSVITVDLAKGGSAEGLADLIGDLFIYYREPTTPAAEVPEVDE
ncbi:MAG TPA: hypothetical protein VHI95_19480 [Acidimicrobiales bacterium]|jgi:hypothetical protein|nr:hypothetical protein [Acidimicrobiales bacterium]